MRGELLVGERCDEVHAALEGSENDRRSSRRAKNGEVKKEFGPQRSRYTSTLRHVFLSYLQELRNDTSFLLFPVDIYTAKRRSRGYL